MWWCLNWGNMVMWWKGTQKAENVMLSDFDPNKLFTAPLVFFLMINNFNDQQRKIFLELWRRFLEFWHSWALESRNICQILAEHFIQKKDNTWHTVLPDMENWPLRGGKYLKTFLFIKLWNHLYSWALNFVYLLQKTTLWGC